MSTEQQDSVDTTLLPIQPQEEEVKHSTVVEPTKEVGPFVRTGKGKKKNPPRQIKFVIGEIEAHPNYDKLPEADRKIVIAIKEKDPSNLMSVKKQNKWVKGTWKTLYTEN
jgi:hypothetical protein